MVMETTSLTFRTQLECRRELGRIPLIARPGEVWTAVPSAFPRPIFVVHIGWWVCGINPPLWPGCGQWWCGASARRTE